MEEQTEIEKLRDRNAFLLKQIMGQINCSFFCALPECFDELHKRGCNDCNDQKDPQVVGGRSQYTGYRGEAQVQTATGISD